MRLFLVSVIACGLMLGGATSFGQTNAGTEGGNPLPRRSELDYRPPAGLDTRPEKALPTGARPVANDSALLARSAHGDNTANLPASAVSPAVSPDAAVSPASATPTLGSGAAGGFEGPQTATDLHLLVSPGHLNDVAFIDAKVGIAVGNQGLVWRTTDGGRRWSPIRTDWTGDLTAITFANEQTGWIVGGRVLPVRGLHEGVVLRTQDGGVTWRRLSSAILPRLRSVHYDHRSRVLWAVGDADGQFPSGLFESYDLGQNWSDVPVKFSAAGEGAGQLGGAGADHPTPTMTSPYNPATVASRMGDQWVVSNRLGLFRVQNGRTTRARSDVPLDSGLSPPPFQQILPVGNRWFALGEDGRLYRSKSQGDRWELVPGAPGVGAGSPPPNLAVMANAGDSLWVASRVGSQVWQIDTVTQTWQSQSWPGTFQCQALHFADEQLGWAVGPMGTVLGTTDGGRNWQWLHRAHAGLAVLVLAADSRDVPPELLAHLATNQGLNVGVLVGKTHVAPAVFQQACAMNEVATTLVDPWVFDTAAGQAGLQVRIRSYLDAFRPKVLLVCPPNPGRTTLAGPALTVPVHHWVETIQSSITRDAESRVAMVAAVAYDDAETSTSSSALATHVGRLLGDLCLPSHQLLNAWEELGPAAEALTVIPTHRAGLTGPKTVGVRRLVSFESTQLTWFHARSSLKDPAVAGLSLRPVRSRTSATNVDTISRLTSKANWLHQMSQVDTRSPETRAQWQRSLTLSLSYLPEPVHAAWLAELAEHCHAAGDPRKATLARWELIQSFLESPEGLAALLPTLQWLISDESQWENRVEARELRQQKFAELQRLFAAEEAEGALGEQELRARALRRFGLEPEMESQVPPEIVERILQLDQVQRQAVRDGQLNPVPDPARTLPVPQPRLQAENPARQFQDRFGQYSQQTMILTWDTPVLPEATQELPATAISSGRTAGVSIVDLPHLQRLEIVDQWIRRADARWPGLNGLPQWWLLKAQVKRQRQEIVPTELAWNRLADMAADPVVAALHRGRIPTPTEAVVEKVLAVASAESGERFDLRSIRNRLDGQTVQLRTASADSAGSALVPIAPVTWTLERPYLDGVLDEAWWGADESEPVALHLAQDEQYLYIGLSLAQASVANLANHAQDVANGPRSRAGFSPINPTRDAADTDEYISLLIDTDGDVFDSFQIDIDAVGRLRDSQGGRSEWSPRMFVAHSIRDGRKTIEMAIDLEDLAPVHAGQPWRFKLVRRTSAEMRPLFQAWGQVASLMD